MPELRLKEVRLPELHLPEMSREDIVRAIGDARRDIDLTRLDPRRIDRSDRPATDLPAADLPKLDLPKLDLTRIDLSKVDLTRALATATQAAGLIRASRRPRLPIVVGGIVAVGLIGFAIMTSPVVRPRLADLAQRARRRLEARRAGTTEGLDAETPVAIPIEPAAFLEPDQAGAPTAAPAETAATEEAVVESAGTAAEASGTTPA